LKLTQKIRADEKTNSVIESEFGDWYSKKMAATGKIAAALRLASETIRLFENELLPAPEGVTMRATAWSNRAFMRVEFEDELLTSAYPELFRKRLIVLAEELGGMFIWIAGFGDPYMKGGAGGGMSNSTIELTGYNSKELPDHGAARTQPPRTQCAADQWRPVRPQRHRRDRDHHRPYGSRRIPAERSGDPRASTPTARHRYAVAHDRRR